MRLRGVLLAVAGTVLVVSGAVRTAAAAPPGLEGIPQYDHVVVLVEENHSFDATFGAGSPATYLNGTLKPQGTMADQYFATGHVSLDNYISMTSGQPGIQGSTNTDCLGISLWLCAQLVSTPSSRNLADQLEGAGLSWAQYSDGTSKPCVHDSYSPLNPTTPDSYQGNGGTPTNNGAGKDYADRHNAWLYYTDIMGTDGQAKRCKDHLLPFSAMAPAIAQDNLPAFSFITPDTCHDGHDAPCADGSAGGLTGIDDWLKGSGGVPALLAYLRSHNGLLILTFDEGTASDTSGCCHGGPLGTAGVGGRIGLLAFGPCVQSGRVVHTPYDHASLLRTLEDSFSISEHLNNAAQSSAMADLFVAGCGRTTGGNPVMTASPGAVTGAGGGTPSTSRGIALAWWMAGGGTVAAGLLVRRWRRRGQARPMRQPRG
jgi:hypothetical protein